MPARVYDQGSPSLINVGAQLCHKGQHFTSEEHLHGSCIVTWEQELLHPPAGMKTQLLPSSSARVIVPESRAAPRGGDRGFGELPALLAPHLCTG